MIPEFLQPLSVRISYEVRELTGFWLTEKMLFCGTLVAIALLLTAFVVASVSYRRWRGIEADPDIRLDFWGRGDEP